MVFGHTHNIRGLACCIAIPCQCGYTIPYDNIRQYTPYEGLTLANQNSRKLGVFNQKL